MKRRLLPVAVLILLAGVLGGQEPDEILSGPQKGARLPLDFDPLNINGEHQGRPHSPITKFGLEPTVVMVLARLPAEGKDGPMIDLLARLDKLVKETNDETYLASFVVFLSKDARSSATVDPYDKLQGTWKAEKITANGKDAPPEEVKEVALEIKGNKIFRTVGGKKKGEFTFQINPTKKPKAIDTIRGDGPDKDKKQLGIYDFEEEKLRLCLGEKERPEEFASPPDSDVVLLVLQRAKAEDLVDQFIEETILRQKLLKRLTELAKKLNLIDPDRLGLGMDKADLPKDQGLKLVEVKADSPAAKAGLKAEDILLKFNDKNVTNDLDAFPNLLFGLKSNTPAPMLVLRGGKTETINFLLPPTLILTCYHESPWKKDAKKPSNLPIHEKAEVTVIVYRKLAVVDNFVFPEGQFGEDDVDLVMKKIEKLLPKRKI